MYIYNGQKGVEYIIEEMTEHNGWCLFKLAGYTMERAQEELAKCQEENPHKQLRIAETRYENNWWNVWSD